MMSVSNVSAGAAASGYYKEEGYYKAGTPEAEKAAQWFGKAAEEIGLTGNVDDQRFAEFLDGQAPDGKQMGRFVDGERQHRPGLDITFSASKSASVAALVIGDARIVDAHDAAVRKAMEVVEERFIKTRYQVDGEMKTANASGIIAGIYRHDTSRALDPNLHSHAVIANMALNEKGEYTAIRNEEIYKNQKLITEIYRTEFEGRMRELGIQTERGKYGEVNISGISQEVVDQFSKRRQEILASLEGKGLEVNPKNAAKATLATRASKHKDLDRAELRAEWRKDALEAGMEQSQLDRGRVGPIAPAPVIPKDQQRPVEHSQEAPAGSGFLKKVKATLAGATPLPGPQGDAARAVAQAIAHISERASVYDRGELTVAALRFSRGAGFDAVDKEIDRRLEQGRLFASAEDSSKLTDKESVALERSILATWRQSERSAGVQLQGYDGRSPESTLATKLAAGNLLSAGQKDAVQTALTGDGRYVGVQGFAGTGKTFMVDRLAHYAQQSGYEVKGYAPSHQAVHELGTVLGSAETLAKVVTAERHHPQEVDNSRTILIVDELSMIGARDMRSFMDYAERTNAARVVFVGDTQQLDAVAAGQPFAQLQQAGMRTAVMDEIRRQRNDDLRASVYHTIRREVTSAFERLGENVEEARDPRQAAADKYLALTPDERAQTRVLTLTNAARAEINEAIRAGLRAEGKLASDGITVDGLQNRQFTEAELADARNYAPGDRVQSLITSKDHGLKKFELYRVTDVDGKANRITVEHEAEGTRLTLPLSVTYNKRELGKSLVAYEPEQRNLSAGDQVRFRITDAASGITNGLRGTIVATSGSMLEAETQDGRRLEIDTASLAARGIEHDYAATAHAVQGETVDRVIVAMHAGERLVSQKSFYVEISRARDSATLITDDAGKLARNVERETGIRDDALSVVLDRWQGKQAETQKDEQKEKSAPETEKHRNTDDRAIGFLPGLFEEKLKEIEKQAERILDRQKEIER